MAKNINVLDTPPQSYWVASCGSTDFPALAENIKVDVAIAAGWSALLPPTC